MILRFDPGLGFREAALDEHRSELRRRFPVYRVVPRDPQRDHFTEVGLIAYYDSEDRVTFLETTPISTVVFDDIQLNLRPLLSVLSDLEDRGFVTTHDPTLTDAKVPALGLRFFAVEGTVESVGAEKIPS